MVKSALVYGGSGALGSCIVKHFCQAKWQVISVDARPNADASHNVVLDLGASWQQQSDQVQQAVAKIVTDSGVNSTTKLDAIVCVAGGWAGGNATADGLVGSCELMWKQSVQSSVVAVQLAAKHLAADGLVVLTGAKAATGGTGGMIGYGMAKAAVHQLTKSLATSGLPSAARAVCIQPITLDTPGNRAAMPSADTSTWTPCAVIADELLSWAEKSTQPPALFVEVATADNETKFTGGSA